MAGPFLRRRSPCPDSRGSGYAAPSSRPPPTRSDAIAQAPDPATTPRPRSIRLLVNPVAGAGRARHAAPAVAAALTQRGWPIEERRTESLQHAIDLAAQASPDTIVAALGGDGFIGAVAAGVRRGGSVLLPLPGGRGNDLVRRLDWPTRPVAAARCVPPPDALVTRRIDVGLVDGRPFLGVASAGFDAVVTRLANETKLLRGAPVYAAAAAWAITTYRPPTFLVQADDDPAPAEVPAWLLAIGNSGRYGGGMRIAPTAQLDDGLLDLITIGPVPRTRFPKVLARVFRGTHLDGRLLTQRHVRRLRIALAPDSPSYDGIYADGEPIATLPVTITLDPAALRVVAPTGRE